MVRLRKAGGIIPTATLRFRTTLQGNVLDLFLLDICYAFSVVQGRKTNLISHTRTGPGNARHTVFGETITKEYTEHALCLNPFAQTAVRPPLSAAAQALPRIRAFRETIDPENRLINAWLDARTEHDYLEARTLKYVIVAEALIAMTTRGHREIPRTIEAPNVWEQRYHTLITALPHQDAPLVTLANWQRLNTPPFRDTLQAVAHAHNIYVDREELGVFHQIRNDIVHRFKYNRRTKLPQTWRGTPDYQAASHFFTASFIDSVILQLFGLATCHDV